MRWLLRILITWAVLIPISYFVGVPYAMKCLQNKTQQETLAQCNQQLHDKGLLGSSASALTQAQGDHYCHCLADPLTFTREDLFDVVRHRQPAHLTTQVNAQVEACNNELQQAIIKKYQPSAPPGPVIIN